MSSTDWIFAGRGTRIEFEEVIDKDSDGVVIGQYIAKRDVLSFNRHQVVQVTAPLTLPESAVGSQSGGGVYGYQGSQKITASATLTSGKRKWICTSDNHRDEGVGASWVVRQQTWEARAEWEKYDWPEV